MWRDERAREFVGTFADADETEVDIKNVSSFKVNVPSRTTFSKVFLSLSFPNDRHKPTLCDGLILSIKLQLDGA